MSPTCFGRATRARRLLILGLGAAVLGGCFRDPDPIDLDDEAPAVHAILEAGADSVIVVVSRPARSTPTRWVPYLGVAGAEVRLIAGEDTTWLEETPAIPCVAIWYGDEGSGEGCYRATLSGPIEPSAMYRLEVRLADGTLIRGETTTPYPVQLRTPEPGLRLTVDCAHESVCYGQDLREPPYYRPVATIPLGWDTPRSIRMAEASLRPVAVYYDGAVYPGSACVLGHGTISRGGFTATRDTLDWRIRNLGCRGDLHAELHPARFDSIRAEISVITWNEHYSRYTELSRGQGIRVDAASQGLEGAYGVFGAVAPATRTVMLIRDPPPVTTAPPDGPRARPASQPASGTSR